MNIIGITGKAGSGKDTVADLLVRDHGFVKVALADPLKRICKEVFGFTDEQLWGPSEKRNAPDLRFPRHNGDLNTPAKSLAQWPLYLTPRHALQQLGTEWGRHCYPNVWVDYALRIAKELEPFELHSLIVSYLYDPKRGVLKDTAPVFPAARGVVISDVRFPNEVDAIRAAGGVIWKTMHGEGLQGAAGAHESERHIDGLEVDLAVPRGGLDTLPYVVAGMVVETKRLMTGRAR